MIETYLWEIGSFIMLFLGSAHIYLLFFTDKFSSKNEAMVEEMKISHPLLTKETTMWKGWIGFNASHSSGVMFIGIINLYIAIAHFAAFESSHFYFLLNIITVAFYLWLAKRYWFKIPFLGIFVTLICYVASYILMLLPS